MPTVPFKDSLKKMAIDNPKFATELLEDALNDLLVGDLDGGRILLRNYINATIGFEELGRRLDRDPKNIMRTLRSTSNPTAANLFEIIQACVSAEGVTVSAHVVAQQHVPS